MTPMLIAAGRVSVGVGTLDQPPTHQGSWLNSTWILIDPFVERVQSAGTPEACGNGCPIFFSAWAGQSESPGPGS